MLEMTWPVNNQPSLQIAEKMNPTVFHLSGTSELGITCPKLTITHETINNDAGINAD